MKISSKNYSTPLGTIVKAIVAFSLVLGVLYIIPSPVQHYAILGYSSLTIFASSMFLIAALSARFVNGESFYKSLEETFRKRVENEDINFIRKISSPSGRWMLNSIMSMIIFCFAVIGGYILNSELLKWSLIFWSFSYLMMIDYVESQIYKRYREQLEELSSNL